MCFLELTVLHVAQVLALLEPALDELGDNSTSLVLQRFAKLLRLNDVAAVGSDLAIVTEVSCAHTVGDVDGVVRDHRLCHQTLHLNSLRVLLLHHVVEAVGHGSVGSPRRGNLIVEALTVQLEQVDSRTCRAVDWTRQSNVKGVRDVRVAHEEEATVLGGHVREHELAIVCPVLARLQEVGVNVDEIVVEVNKAGRKSILAARVEDVLRTQWMRAPEHGVMGDALVVDAARELLLVEEGTAVVVNIVLAAVALQVSEPL